MGGAEASDAVGRVAADGLPPRSGISALAPQRAAVGHLPQRAARGARRLLARNRPESAAPSNGARGDRVLVAGWFSWAYHGVTAGDVLACDVVCGWLTAASR